MRTRSRLSIFVGSAVGILSLAMSCAQYVERTETVTPFPCPPSLPDLNTPPREDGLRLQFHSEVVTPAAAPLCKIQLVMTAPCLQKKSLEDCLLQDSKGRKALDPAETLGTRFIELSEKSWAQLPGSGALPQEILKVDKLLSQQPR